MDSDLAWVNGKSGRQSRRYADAFQRSIISEAIYHLPFLTVPANPVFKVVLLFKGECRKRRILETKVTTRRY